MKAIINGKRYNTETATEIADYWNGLATSDFRKIRETLYQTPKGAWFLEYHGGAGTEYADHDGNAYSGSSGIKPLEPDEACQWLERHEKLEALETYFPTDIQDA